MPDLVGVAAQELDVGLDAVDLLHLHPPLDPAQEGVVLVAVEVMAGLVAQDRGDAGDVLSGVALLRVDGGTGDGKVGGVGGDPHGRLLGGHDEIN